ncbi:MAG: hypothetical protein P8N51_10825 [Pseudomonadales bacterium]|nr:hypothetical protein [Pseudomonadales bacterium]MDG1444657.1 hypothetical protein [Pseudomonadales bacterium]
MNVIRQRAKENFPTVLLSILGIMQALAMEILWSKIQELDYLFEFSMLSVIAWSQIAATFMSVVIVWVSYSSSAMRFRWVPTTMDSIFPFLIGLVEFTMIESIDPNEPGQWLLAMTLIFASMHGVSHSMMRAARKDADNAFFFASVLPAKLSDFKIEFTLVLALFLTSIYFLFSNDHTNFALLLPVIAVNALLLFQLYLVEGFWARSTAEHVKNEEPE